MTLDFLLFLVSPDDLHKIKLVCVVTTFWFHLSFIHFLNSDDDDDDDSDENDVKPQKSAGKELKKVRRFGGFFWFMLPISHRNVCIINRLLSMLRKHLGSISL